MKPGIVATCISMWVASATYAVDPVRVLIWDEQQPEQKQAYGDSYLGGAIAAHLRNQPGITVRTASLEDADQGFNGLSSADVLIYWCHRRVKEQSDKMTEAIVQRVLDGQLSLIALHSAHWAKPFVRLMQERAKSDALAQIPKTRRSTAQWEYVNDQPYGKLLAADAALTPSLQELSGGVWRLTLPQCVFPTYRNDGAASHVTTLVPDHPLATGLPTSWDIPQTEMYGEPFHVPTPDAIVFEETWDKGERFPSGSLWRVRRGTVFYFRPGHETYPIYRQAEPLRVIENAVRWLPTNNR